MRIGVHRTRGLHEAMTWQQGAILAVLACTLAVFVWDRWRYDVVAIASLMACVLLGLIGPEAAFAGFSNPAVITVAAVLVISRALGALGRDRRARGQADRRRQLAARPPGLVLRARRAAVRLHEQCRRARPAAAGGPVDGAAPRLRARPAADAALVRDPARRHDDPDRDAAEPPDLGVSGRGDRGSASCCSTSRRPVSRSAPPASPISCWSAGAFCPAGGAAAAGRAPSRSETT